MDRHKALGLFFLLELSDRFLLLLEQVMEEDINLGCCSSMATDFQSDYSHPARAGRKMVEEGFSMTFFFFFQLKFSAKNVRDWETENSLEKSKFQVC